MKKAIIYARQSSGSETASESIDVQIINCKALAEKMDLEILGIFHDYNVSGKTYPAGFETVVQHDQAFLNWVAKQSGYKKFREGLGRLLQKLPQADFLIVDEITRLYRPLMPSLPSDTDSVRFGTLLSSVPISLLSTELSRSSAS